jgi:hypothetical protein
MTALLRWSLPALAALALTMTAASRACAQTDEIQVYNAEINEPGQASLTLHDNYTPLGRRNPDFPHGLQPQGTLNGVPEWAYGVTNWFEAGLYLPLYSYETSTDQFMLNGFKVRGLFVEPHADQHQFFYGLNFEFSYNASHWDPRRYTSEIRPILGQRFGPVDVIVNPILDNSYYGGLRGLDFAPAERIDYNFSQAWAVALEHYADYGQLRHFVSVQNQVQELFAVVDYTGEPMDVEAGIGHGFTAASDDLVLKLILARTF